MVVKAGVVIITGTLLAQTFAPACSAHDLVRETLPEPWHIHHELPTGGTIRGTASAVVSGSNVTVGMSHVKLAANIVVHPKNLSGG